MGPQSCARETSRPPLASDSSQAATTHVTKPNRGAGFWPKPGRWVQLLLFISRWMGLNWLQAKAPLANPSFNAPLELLSSLTCGESATAKTRRWVHTAVEDTSLFARNCREISTEPQPHLMPLLSSQIFCGLFVPPPRSVANSLEQNAFKSAAGTLQQSLMTAF